MVQSHRVVVERMSTENNANRFISQLIGVMEYLKYLNVETESKHKTSTVSLVIYIKQRLFPDYSFIIDVQYISSM